MAKHGTRYMYQTKGCRCDPCTQANRDYFKTRGQNKRAEEHGVTPIAPTVAEAPATPIAAPEPPPIGDNEKAVRAELEHAPAAIARPGLFQVAITLARLLDSPIAMAQWPSAADKLNKILDQLRKGAEKKTKLAAVRQMSKPTTATG